MSQEAREVFNLVRSTQKVCDFGVTSQHWQLKDMLKIKGESLIFPRTCNVMSHDLHTNATKAIYEGVDFFPTSICLKDDILAVGGSRGHLKIKNLATNEVLSQIVSSSINNNICINSSRIFICNNDRTLKIFTMDLRSSGSISHVAQVNSCAISPDNKLLAVVGDSNDVFLYSIDNDSYKLVKRLKSTEDGGFSVSWNSTSSSFAVGTQDGYVCIWDVRSDGILHRFESKQKDSHKGAVRNVKFSLKNSLDLLFFTEHFSFLTVCDMRDLRRCQRIRIFPDKQITGAVFSEANDKIFVSTEDEVAEININSKSRRMFAGI
ncbi:hypothetical protein [Encephalitozoon cuniculi GB-M1]|uniref:DUF2415 domain-containing protein n=2 Tax=Encephalitozoon cuniculi TaxID=6035 RepID=Q8STM2_ENCCU|nr:uncharacterized protein ECU09_1660 [Encephalitozoon cuniculi GB-M1]AGE96326.1 hypothetical protein ECU09_1660 [Encephalitozoon cuniculi]KMV65346.1 hypothetical protein M970_091660 [Encephalitozoon cuniculi EcunIII-L]UYI26860.1 hypothetical protein J0A71_03g06980 [Encephalitozoon cuniculi]CAD27138.1 hypothetical protein [Encephalitozoon cuniculi GB-M1]